METKQLTETAALLNVKAYIERGRFKMEGTGAATLLRVWAACGFDYRKDHEGKQTSSWEISYNGSFVGLVLLDKSNQFAYSYTAIA